MKQIRANYFFLFNSTSTWDSCWHKWINLSSNLQQKVIGSSTVKIHLHHKETEMKNEIVYTFDVYLSHFCVLAADRGIICWSFSALINLLSLRPSLNIFYGFLHFFQEGKVPFCVTGRCTEAYVINMYELIYRQKKHKTLVWGKDCSCLVKFRHKTYFLSTRGHNIKQDMNTERRLCMLINLSRPVIRCLIFNHCKDQSEQRCKLSTPVLHFNVF